jgi:hypothetical protein
MKRLSVARALFVFSTAVAVFLWGIAVGRYELFPFRAIKFGVQSALNVFKERNTITGARPDHFLEPARYDGSGVVRSDAKRMAEGLTFIQGFFDNGNEMRLIRADGSIVSRWPVRFSAIVKDTGHIHTDYFVPKTDWNIELHGGLVQPDGAIVFNFERGALVKADRCGAIQWVLPRMTHHSVEPSADGGFWVPGIRYVGSADASPFPLIKRAFYEDTIMKVSAEGHVVAEWSLPGLLFSNHLESSILFANGMPDLELQKSTNKVSEEITHLNDVEELRPELAARFPQFTAGDLLISERDYNLLMVIDSATQTVKWLQQGPWFKQHDPDFEPSGRISVFSNNMDGTENGSTLGGSTILDIDPATRAVTRAFGGRADQRMFSKERGKHQRLANGNILITESSAGRILEVDAAGEVVWEFINRYDKDHVAIVTEATRYPPEYFTVRDWSCPAVQQ